jgi:hypothetical protein
LPAENKNGVGRDRSIAALMVFVVFFLTIDAFIILFIFMAKVLLWEGIVLGICCLALALIPVLIFYLLYLRKISKGTNFFLFDIRLETRKELSAISDDEIKSKLELYMNTAFVCYIDMFKSRYSRWLDRHIISAPADYFMFFIIRLFQLALKETSTEKIDDFFLKTKKSYFDELSSQLYKIGADQLAAFVLHYRAVYTEDKEGAVSALRDQMGCLDQCLVHYVRTHIDEFTR